MELKTWVAWGKGSGEGYQSDFLGWWRKKYFAMSIRYIILVKLNKYFCNVNSKHGLAKWLHAFINLLDNAKLSFRKLHHTMLSQHCWNTSFFNSSSSIWRKILLSFIFLIELWQFAWWEIIFHYWFGFISFYYQSGSTFLPDFL